MPVCILDRCRGVVACECSGFCFRLYILRLDVSFSKRELAHAGCTKEMKTLDLDAMGGYRRCKVLRERVGAIRMKEEEMNYAETEI